MKKRCPHQSVLYCPLYEATHMAIGIGCDDGHLDEGGCAVARGRNYTYEVRRLIAVAPEVVARNKWNEELAQRSAQRLRNMRLGGVH